MKHIITSSRVAFLVAYIQLFLVCKIQKKNIAKLTNLALQVWESVDYRSENVFSGKAALWKPLIKFYL